jgi:hypothetical protein
MYEMPGCSDGNLENPRPTASLTIRGPRPLTGTKRDTLVPIQASVHDACCSLGHGADFFAPPCSGITVRYTGTA